MKKLFLLFSFCLLSAVLSAQELPEKGRVLYFDFNGLTKDKVAGVELEKAGEHRGEPITDIRFVDTDKEKNGALVMNGVYLADFKINADNLPQMTVVMRLKVSKLGKPHFMDFFGNSNYNTVAGLSIGSRAIELTEDGRLNMLGYADAERNKYGTIVSETALGDEYTTIIAVFDKGSLEKDVVIGREWYHYSPYSSTWEDNETYYPSFVFGREEMEGAIDFLAIYDYKFSEEEMAAAAGGELDRKEFNLKSDGGRFHPFFLLHIALIVLVILGYRKRKLLSPENKETLKRYPKPLDKVATREKAWQYMEEAHSYWKWQEEPENGELHCFYPGKKDLERSYTAYHRAIETGCDDDDLIYEYNEFVAVYNHAQGYVFHGWGWIPLLVLLGMFGSHFFPWLLGGRDSFSQTMTEAFFSWQALGYYVGIIAYIFVANCPRFRAYNGDEVEEPRELADKMADFAGSMMAGVGKAAGMAGQGISKAFRFMDWVGANSLTKVNWYRNGKYVKSTHEMNPTGLVTLAIVVVGGLVLLSIFSFILVAVVFLAAPVQYVVNHWLMGR